MKANHPIPLAVIALAFALTGCSGDNGGSGGRFPAPPEPISTPTPTASPSPSPTSDDHRRELGAVFCDSSTVTRSGNSPGSSL